MGINSTEVAYGFGQLGSAYTDIAQTIVPPKDHVIVAIQFLADNTPTVLTPEKLDRNGPGYIAISGSTGDDIEVADNNYFNFNGVHASHVTNGTIAAGGDVTASSTTTFTNKTIDADGTGNSISNIDIGNMTSAVVVTESDTIAGNDNDTTLPTSAAVKGYVDAQGFADIGLIIALG